MPVAEALHFMPKTVERAARGCNPITAKMAFPVAKLAGVSIDDLLAGRFLPGACPKCGHVTDFADEDKQVGAASWPARGGGIRLVR